MTRWTTTGVLAAAAALVTLTACQGLTQPPPQDSSDAAFVLPTITKTLDLGSSPDRVVTTSDAIPPGVVPAPEGSGYQKYFNQKLKWADCETDDLKDAKMRCAEFLAPLDWENPDGEWAITIAMASSHRGGGQKKILFVNPGGPGAPARDYAAHFQMDGLEEFAVVGVDPRGTGGSTPVVCGDGPQTDAFFGVDASPEDQAEREQLIAAQRQFNEQCRENSGILLDHISTVETVHDHNLARRLMGKETFSYYGVSYGTYVGSLLALLYPDRVERQVLDSTVSLDPDDTVSQAEGFDQSFEAFANWCAGEADCALGDSRDEVVNKVTSWLDELDQTPLATSDGRFLTQSLAASGILQFMYFDEESYGDLANVLLAAMNGQPDYLLFAADFMNQRLESGEYDSMTYAFPAISCADEPDSGVDQAWEDWAEDQQKAPILARVSGAGLACQLWPAAPAQMPDFTDTHSSPILIVQNTGDSATPFHDAEVMTQKLVDSTLLVRESPGHGAYAAGSKCVDDAVVAFLTDGTTPAEGTRCTDG